jgi:hypothetical protein
MCDNNVLVEDDLCDSQTKSHEIDVPFGKENLCGSTCSENQDFALNADNTFDKHSDSYCFRKRTGGAFHSCKLENIPNVPVKKMLLEIASDLNKSEEEMAPFIELLVCRQWIENVSHLKLMTVSDWKSLGLPYQLFKAIQQKLEEPYVVQMSNDSTQCSESGRPTRFIYVHLTQQYTCNFFFKENPPFDQQQTENKSSVQENSSKPPYVSEPATNLVEFVKSVCDAHNIPSHQKDQALHWYSN